MIETILVAASFFALGFGVRHWSQGKWPRAEAAADRAKSEWDKRNP